MNSRISPYFMLLAISLAWLSACQTDPGEIVSPENPFDQIVYPEPPSPSPEPDSASIVGLHKYIFSQSCAVPGCHDGNFEPDFRTVQSSYSSLVYQPLIKNTLNQDFRYRVLPFQADSSWLHYRVTTDDQDLGRMPLYDNQLTSGQIKAIRTWINQGAPDMFGNISVLPDRQPTFSGLSAFLNFGQIEYRVDTIRGNQPYNPFGVLPNRDVTIWFALQDDSTEIANLADTRILFSDQLDNFDQALRVNAVYAFNPKVVPDFFGQGQDGTFHWYVTVNTSAVPSAPVEPGGPAISFMRLLTNDGNHTDDFVFPGETHPIEYKLYMSFFLAP
jgi:hypothetical protein